MTSLKIAVLHIGDDAIGIETAIGFTSLLRDAGHYVVLGASAESRAMQFCSDNGGPWDELRSVAWLPMSQQEYKLVFNVSCDSRTVMRPLDGGLDFRDCDYWIVVGDMPTTALAPLVPYAIYITDHIAFLRKSGVEYGEAILDTLRGADLLIFPSDFQANEWCAMALAYEMPVLFGKPPVVKALGDGKKFHHYGEKSFAYFPTAHQFTLLPALLGIPVPDDSVSPSLEQVMFTPLEGLAETTPRIRPQWANSLIVDSTPDLVKAVIAESEFMLIGPLVDPQDYRLQIAKELGKPVLMFWGKDLGPFPQMFSGDISVVSAGSFEEIEREIIQFASEKNETTSQNNKRKSAKLLPEVLDAEALSLRMIQGAGT